jgi:hypothetical protein
MTHSQQAYTREITEDHNVPVHVLSTNRARKLPVT